MDSLQSGFLYGGDILTLGEVSCEFGFLAVFHRKIDLSQASSLFVGGKKKGISSSVDRITLIGNKEWQPDIVSRDGAHTWFPQTGDKSYCKKSDYFVRSPKKWEQN